MSSAIGTELLKNSFASEIAHSPFLHLPPMGYLALSGALVIMPPIICVAWTKRGPHFFISVKQKVGLLLNSPFKYVLKFHQTVKSTI